MTHSATTTRPSDAQLAWIEQHAGRILAAGALVTGNIVLVALLGIEVPDSVALTERLTDDYPSLPSRFEPVDVVRGVSWIDDALASNPTATAAALERVAPGPVVLICGGHDRNVSLDPVLHELDRWPDGSLAVVWLGDDRDPRNQLLAAHPAVGVDLLTPTMPDAVVVAALVARPGWTVLFSPLAPTERAEGAWTDRSRAYREAIAGL